MTTVNYDFAGDGALGSNFGQWPQTWCVRTANQGAYRRFWHTPSLNCVGVCNATPQKMQVLKLG